MKIAFTKMQALGNDFVIIDATKQAFNVDVQIIRQIADRHFGIGCDQVILLTKAAEYTQKISDVYYRIFNADGKEAGQSGNGARCVAKYANLHGFTDDNTIIMRTPARTVKAVINNDDQITIDMGIAELMPKKIPLLINEQASSYDVTTSIGKFTIGALSLGNPHAVIKVADTKSIDVEKIGSILSEQSIFPEGVNVNFIQIIDKQHIRLRTYERGSGETLACGSGACASVAIGRLWELLDRQVTVYFHKGNLMINCININSPIVMIGTASIVFTGDFDSHFLKY